METVNHDQTGSGSNPGSWARIDPKSWSKGVPGLPLS
jgi:hypothetical protein